MTLTSRINSFTAHTLRAAAHVALALADRLDPPMVTPVEYAPTAPLWDCPTSAPTATEPQETSGPSVGVDVVPAVDSGASEHATRRGSHMASPHLAERKRRRRVRPYEPAPPTTIAPEAVERWLAESAANEPVPPAPAEEKVDEAQQTETPRPAITLLVQPPPTDGDDDASRCVAHADKPGARSVRRTGLLDLVADFADVARIMRELEAEMPIARAARIMREALAPTNAKTEPVSVPPADVRTEPQPPPIIIDPNMALTPVPRPVSQPTPKSAIPMRVSGHFVREQIIAIVLYEASRPERAVAIRRQLFEMGVPGDMIERAVEAQRIGADLTSIVPVSIPRLQPTA